MTVLYKAESASLQTGETGVQSVTLTDGRVVPCRGVPGRGRHPAELRHRRAGRDRLNKGILVDDRMQSSAPGVFAAGDVAEHGGLVLGLWPIAAKQGEAAAVNALGGDQRLVAEIPATILKGVDLELLLDRPAPHHLADPSAAAASVLAAHRIVRYCVATTR